MSSLHKKRTQSIPAEFHTYNTFSYQLRDVYLTHLYPNLKDINFENNAFQENLQTLKYNKILLHFLEGNLDPSLLDMTSSIILENKYSDLYTYLSLDAQMILDLENPIYENNLINSLDPFPSLEEENSVEDTLLNLLEKMPDSLQSILDPILDKYSISYILNVLTSEANDIALQNIDENHLQNILYSKGLLSSEKAINLHDSILDSLAKLKSFSPNQDLYNSLEGIYEQLATDPNLDSEPHLRNSQLLTLYSNLNKIQYLLDPEIRKKVNSEWFDLNRLIKNKIFLGKVDFEIYENAGPYEALKNIDISNLEEQLHQDLDFLLSIKDSGTESLNQDSIRDLIKSKKEKINNFKNDLENIKNDVNLTTESREKRYLETKSKINILVSYLNFLDFNASLLYKKPKKRTEKNITDLNIKYTQQLSKFICNYYENYKHVDPEYGSNEFINFYDSLVDSQFLTRLYGDNLTKKEDNIELIAYTSGLKSISRAVVLLYLNQKVPTEGKVTETKNRANDARKQTDLEIVDSQGKVVSIVSIKSKSKTNYTFDYGVTPINEDFLNRIKGIHYFRGCNQRLDLHKVLQSAEQRGVSAYYVCVDLSKKLP